MRVIQDTIHDDNSELSCAAVGIGLRPAYSKPLLQATPEVECLEVMADDFIGVGGAEFRELLQLKERYPMMMHSVGLSIAGTEPIDVEFVQSLKTLTKTLSAELVSDHLCWTGVDGRESRELLPFPFTEDTLSHVIARVRRVQDILEQQLVLENITSYIEFNETDLSEAVFWTELIQESGCGLLLDVNNLYVNSQNLRYDPLEFLDSIPLASIKQYHLAGYQILGEVHLDTHDAEISQPVYDLYQHVWSQKPAPTILERDDAFPPLSELIDELCAIRQAQSCLSL